MYRIIGGDQKEYGPATAQELEQWISEGRLSGQSLVQVEGSGEWKPLSRFPEFTDALRAQASHLAAAGGAAPAESAESWQGAVPAGPVRLEIGRCLAQSWELLAGNFGVLAGASCLAWVLSLVCQFIPLIGGVVYWLARGVIFGGLYLVFLRRIRGQPASPGDVFSTFGPQFTQLMLVGLVSGLLTNVGTFCCLLLPGLYVFVAWSMSVPLVADRRLEFWSAMELSRKVVTRVWFEMFGLMVLAFLPVILAYIFITIKTAIMTYPAMRELMAASQPDFRHLVDVMMEVAKASIPLALLFKVVLLLNLPFATGALMYAYEALFGTRPTPKS